MTEGKLNINDITTLYVSGTDQNDHRITTSVKLAGDFMNESTRDVFTVQTVNRRHISY